MTTMTSHTLSELLALDELHGLMQAFYGATKIPVGICDRQNNWLVALGWQDICVKFHRAEPRSCEKCVESDHYIERHLHGGGYVAYPCVHGLIDVAFPIMVKGSHVGTFFIGQFLHAPADRLFFERQAEHYGYDHVAYMRALDTVPIISKARVDLLMQFFMRLVNLVTRLCEENLARRQADEALRELNQSLEASVALRTQELRGALAQLSELAIHDALTGAFNRRHFDQVLQQEIERSVRHERPLALVMFDLDHFKQINDVFGHAAGDQVLQATVQAVLPCLRPNDLLARWGGEEFIIILPETNLLQAQTIAERIRQGVADLNVLPDRRVTCSLGIAQWDDMSAERFVKNVDAAMYCAKSQGRNRLVCHPACLA